MRPRIIEGHKLLAHSVRHWREIRGLDTEMLAQVVGWSLAMIEGIESGELRNITLNDIDQLAEALAVQVADLFSMARSC